jgi:hypothetical protein
MLTTHLHLALRLRMCGAALYPYYRYMPPWRGNGQLLFIYIYIHIYKYKVHLRTGHEGLEGE